MTFDYALFDFLNQSLANPVFDAVLPVFREKTTWVPLYLVMVILLVRQYGWEKTAYLLLCIAGVLTVADQLAATVLKPWIGRLRPCAEPTIADHARVLVSCGGKYSFPSNHATNHFALATVLALTWLHKHTAWRWAIFVWAALISLAQVYVGKHFPADIVFGAFLGSVLAFTGVALYRRLAGDKAVGYNNAPSLRE